MIACLYRDVRELLTRTFNAVLATTLLVLACFFTVFVVVHNVADKFLKRLKPHPEHRAELGEPVDVAGNVEFLFFANMPDQLLRKRVTILAERIVVLAVPKLSKLVNDLINLIPTVIR